MARKMGFDLLHAHSRCSDADIYSLHWGPHGFWTREILRRKPRWSDRLRMRIDARMIERGHGRVFMPVSGLQQEIFEQEYGSLPGTWKVVTPGVDVERFSPARLAPMREATRHELGVQPNERVVLFVGMNWESKGLETLIRALGKARAHSEGSRLRLLIVGKGDEARFRRVAHEVGCEQAVLFAGVHKVGVERFFAAADLFAMPAEFETFSMVTLEAMVSGLPVIVSDRMGVRELVGEHGAVLSSPVEPTALCSALIAQTIGDDPMNSRVARYARAEKKNWNRCAETIALSYDEFLLRAE
jgi:UDP-glucose:(heptosyl)LPS alpha-1,3-glucosyltransferase